MVKMVEKGLSFVSAKSLERYEVVTVKPIQLSTLWNSAFPNWRSLEKFILAASDRRVIHSIPSFLSAYVIVFVFWSDCVCTIYFLSSSAPHSIWLW